MISPRSLRAVISSAAGHGRFLRRQRVIATSLKGITQPGIHATTIVRDHRGLAMHQTRRGNDPPAEVLHQRLVTEAYAEDRHPLLEGRQHGQRHAGIVRGGRARARCTDGVGFERQRLRHR
jgi:hypothetical protein